MAPTRVFVLSKLDPTLWLPLSAMGDSIASCWKFLPLVGSDVSCSCVITDWTVEF
jgi:hypothetical protein